MTSKVSNIEEYLHALRKTMESPDYIYKRNDYNGDSAIYYLKACFGSVGYMRIKSSLDEDENVTIDDSEAYRHEGSTIEAWLAQAKKSENLISGYLYIECEKDVYSNDNILLFQKWKDYKVNVLDGVWTAIGENEKEHIIYNNDKTEWFKEHFGEIF